MKRLALFLLTLTGTLAAAIQYPGGTVVNDTFTGDTRQHVVDGVSAKLQTAGWSCITTCTAGTADVILQSATTPSASNLIQTELKEPGSGNCAQVTMRNVAGSKISQIYYLLPGAAKVFRVVASQYQFAVYTAGASAAREFVMMGTLYIPTWLDGVITAELGFIQGNSISDASASIISSFRTVLQTGSGTNAYTSGLVNGNLDNANNVGAAVGSQTLVGNFSALQSTIQNYLWHDGTQMLSDALIGWGLTATTDLGAVRGQLWGSVILSDSWGADTTLTFDTHTWITLTNTNNGSAGGSARGTLTLQICAAAATSCSGS